MTSIKLSMSQFLYILERLSSPSKVLPNKIITIIVQDESTMF